MNDLIYKLGQITMAFGFSVFLALLVLIIMVIVGILYESYQALGRNQKENIWCLAVICMVVTFFGFFVGIALGL